ncbi:hypothetical protein H2200_001060 [Cladophialophora chaetospira]|uniref:Uncharacterized protein n=1 Tax=Cladophialophora chaetospira TaxID=386627 RepID=A0AA38XKA6_9EURO|nr:hypothetical protein H2200_001060 [Cladophialophora chaetospira]
MTLMLAADSWIEISSRASSASLSSTNNDIITTGLQVPSRDERRSRQLRPSRHIEHLPPRSTSAAGSSQDEYDESESESDRVMNSSNEDIYQDDANNDDDDTSTALGVGSMGRIFTPQPNAFSHPPTATIHNAPVPDSYFPFVPSEPHADRTVTQRSYQRQTQSRHRPAASSYQADHDAALRASLTTLLSCAAAVRPKGSETRPSPPRAPAQPTTLRLVPESELSNPSRQKRTSSPKQTKRKSRESSKDRQAKKVRSTTKTAATTNDEPINPTLATWMISAGVVLVFSAISFSAGYAWGREVGRIEGEMGLPGGSCGREAMKSSGSGLRRLRWSSTTSSIRA